MPPTAATFAETDGQSVPGLSPVDAKYTTPLVKEIRVVLSLLANSPEPQLLDTPSGSSHQLAGEVLCAQQIRKRTRSRLHQNDFAFGAIALDTW